MSEITINTMGAKPVSFVGKLATQKEGVVEFADGIQRRYLLKVYTIASGGFVPSIEYFSDASNEQTGCVAETVDLYKDIENFFFVFVPEEVLPKSKGLDRDAVGARQKLSTKLRKAYETLAFAFLDELKEKLESDTDAETGEAKQQTGSREFSI